MADPDIEEVLRHLQRLQFPVPRSFVREWEEQISEDQEARTITQSTFQSSAFAPESVEGGERFVRSMTEVDNLPATAGHLPSLPTTMRQRDDSPNYNEEDSFLHARPAHVSATSSTVRESLQTRSPTPDFLSGTHSGLNSGPFEAPLFGFSPSPPGIAATGTTAGILDPDILALNNTNRSRIRPGLQLSPPHYPQSDIAPNYNQRSMHQPSLSSGRSTPSEFPPQRRTRQGMQDFIDLTADSTSPTMPAAAPNMTSRRMHGSHEANSSSVHASKRRKIQSPASPNPTSFKVRDQSEKIEEVDLRNVDDDTKLSKVLEQQRSETVKSQQKDGDQPIKLSNLQCIICMEPMTNITATHCGHLFCHTCLMEALIAGEQQTEPGKTPLSRCPVCRKKVRRQVPGTAAKEVIPLELKFATKRSLAKDKPTP